METKKAEYAPLDSLRMLLDGTYAVGLSSSGSGYQADVSIPGSDPIRISAPSIGLMMRAMELISHGFGPAELRSIDIDSNGELVGATEENVRRWSLIRWMMGPVLELQEMPPCSASGQPQVSELALAGRLLGEQANGVSLPDHLLVRAAMALDVALRGAESGFMPSAALLVDQIAAQFLQSSDGETDARKSIIWNPIDMTPRFPLPDPWGALLGRMVGQGECFRGGNDGERFLASRAMVVRVDEVTYQAAEACVMRTASLAWSDLAAIAPDATAVPLPTPASDRLQLDHGRWAVHIGPVWIDERYVEIMRELGVQHVFVGKGGLAIVAPGAAVAMPISPEGIERVLVDGPTPDPQPRPTVGERYIVTLPFGQSLVRITYKSEQRMLAVCEGRRRVKSGEWMPDGSESEWSTAYGTWEIEGIPPLPVGNAECPGFQ